jgi:predicted RNA-binding protein (virulence factor B family)
MGTRTAAFVNKIRPDGKIDLILKNSSGDALDDIASQILEKLNANKGVLAINDKSSSEQIAKVFKVSRKKFKTALAGLYSKRIIKVTPSGIELVKKD